MGGQGGSSFKIKLGIKFALGQSGSVGNNLQISCKSRRSRGSSWSSCLVGTSLLLLLLPAAPFHLIPSVPLHSLLLPSIPTIPLSSYCAPMYGYWVKSKVNCCEFSLFLTKLLHTCSLEECAQWPGLGEGSYLPDWDFNKFSNCQTLIFELKTTPTTSRYDCVCMVKSSTSAMSLQIQVKNRPPSSATWIC